MAPMATGDNPLPVSSSAEPDFHPDQRQFYQEVLRLLMAHKVPFAVSGAFALHQHTGIWRTTKDLDLFLTAETMPGALDLLRQVGMECEICDPVWLAKTRRGEHFVDLITGMSNAALKVTDSWIERAKPAVVVDVETRVLAAEELLASKLFVVRRERFDGADIAHIVYGAHGKLDWNRIMDLAGAHWEMLLWSLLLFRYAYPAQSHYVPLAVWADLLNRLATELKNPSPSARFRGSLVDDKMFAIDVSEWGLDDLLSEYRARRTAEIQNPAGRSVAS